MNGKLDRGAEFSAPRGKPANWDESFLREIRAQMLKFASLYLADPDAAEDAVQEALTAAMANASSFAGGSAFKTWVFAILKNKLADALRRRSRLVQASELLRESDEEAVRDLFDEQGYWRVEERPKSWGDQEQTFSNAEFWRVFEVCLDHLPARQARVFMMREFLEDGKRRDLFDAGAQRQQPARPSPPRVASLARVHRKSLVQSRGDMLNCLEATRLMSEGHERALSLQERLSLRLHTAMCAGCRNARAQFEVLRRAARAYARGYGAPSPHR